MLIFLIDYMLTALSISITLFLIVLEAASDLYGKVNRELI
jgi:hypothetical protein